MVDLPLEEERLGGDWVEIGRRMRGRWGWGVGGAGGGEWEGQREMGGGRRWGGGGGGAITLEERLVERCLGRRVGRGEGGRLVCDDGERDARLDVSL